MSSNNEAGDLFPYMISWTKYNLLLCLFASTLCRGHTNGIDSLSTKEDVRKFFIVNLAQSGVTFPNEFADISYSSHINSNDSYSCYSEAKNYPISSITTLMDSLPWSFYKGDIDCNGYTDLVIDAGIVVVIMDKMGGFEGHIFSSSREVDSYGFKEIISLPDGTAALALRHDHNPCRSVEHLYWGGDVKYITDTVAGKGNTKLRIDTVYKITTVVDSERRPIPGSDSYKMTKRMYADTVYMNLYNMVDTVVYVFNGFTNYKWGFKPSSILKIDYNFYRSTDVDGCSTDCWLEINKNGKCYFQHSRGSVLSAQLDEKKVKNLWGFMAHIDFRSKKNVYRCETDHGEGAQFIIYFDDGTVKTISTWEYRPTIDLAYLSNIFFGESKNMNWMSLQPQQHGDLSNLSGLRSSSYDGKEQDNEVECRCK